MIRAVEDWLAEQPVGQITLVTPQPDLGDRASRTSGGRSRSAGTVRSPAAATLERHRLAVIAPNLSLKCRYEAGISHGGPQAVTDGRT
jgi:hypothetical protein